MLTAKIPGKAHPIRHLWTPCLLMALAALAPGCGARAQRDAASTAKDLGGSSPALQHCGTLAYDFDKYAPAYLELLRDLGTRACLSAPAFTPPGPDAPLPTIDRGSAAGIVALPSPPDGVTPADLKGECRNTLQYTLAIRDHLTAIQNAWQQKACDRTAAAAQKTNIVDYPACRVGCVDGDTACSTCRHKSPQTIGALLGDPQGQITCQTREDARQAVKDWCRFTGMGECKDADVECHDASVAVQMTGASGSVLEDRLTAQVTRQITTSVAIAGEIPGVVKAEGKAGVTVGAQLTIGMSIRGRTMSPWVERYGRREGSPAATVECDINESFFTAVAGTSKVEVGLKFFGNGVSGAVEVLADGRTTYSHIGTSFTIPVAGLTAEQITGRCAVWTMNFLKTQIQNTGVARAVERFSAGTEGRHVLAGADVGIGYTANDSAYRVAELIVDIGTDVTTVRYSLAYRFWFDPASPEYRIPNARIAPFKDEIVGGGLSRSRLVAFLNEVVRPYTSGSWQIDFAWE